jgi:hypothetical protein
VISIGHPPHRRPVHGDQQKFQCFGLWGTSSVSSRISTAQDDHQGLENGSSA